MGLEPVGSYALRIKFDDLHQAGLYTWPFLYELGTHKLSYSRQYIRELRERGLSREPSTLFRAKARALKALDSAALEHSKSKPR